MPHLDSRTVANWFIRRAQRDRGRTLTNMQLQKLVYFAHGWALGLHNDSLIREQIEAWEFGPVVPALYRALAPWGASPVEKPIPDIEPERIEPFEEDVLEQVYASYAGLSAYNLSALTHKRGTPWERTFEPGRRGAAINSTLIADHFSDLAAHYSEAG